MAKGLVMRKSIQYLAGALISVGISGHAFSTSSSKADRRITALQWFKDKKMELAIELYQNLALSSANENIALSPYSISKSLTMLLAGAESTTKSEIFDTLNLGQTFTEDMVHDLASQLIAEIENREQRAYSLEAASAIWSDDQLTLNDDFQSILAQYYQTPARTLDFSWSPESSRQQINQWASDQTAGHIKELLPEGSINQDTKLVATDALFYKGAWLFPFSDKLLTYDIFYKADGNESPATFMNIRAEYPYYSDDNFEALALPIIAKDQQSSYEQVMIFAQPKDPTRSLADLEAQMSSDLLKAMWQKHRKTHVDFSLPKFKFRSQNPLKNALSEMGMTLAFDPYRADFSGVFEYPVEGLYLTDVYHQAYIDVNEKGLEASAATAAVAGCTSAPIEVLQMTLNRPFMFYIYDIPSQSVMFMGRVHNPS
jgi:serpin B